ncbi:hypothetical protein OF829_16660 [Sphingomonas sp. LB-2]|uniref:hypothetical protein n=1 Tax=Sphingomonas caeni TaxID=2984949 RepID=UPI00222F9387|nr:hypothetical protein [Sphingomonas caeni]MCW3848870.1 hypothetical protein [Sphingomonas caeni]
MSGAPIPSGDIRFYDAYKPALAAGETPYTLTATQQVTSIKGAALSQAPSASASFWISAPRFTLDPSEIQSLFPPANSTGDYDAILPNIVLKERSLPWERELASGEAKPPNANSPAYPWLALLVFAEDEIILPPATAGMVNPTRTVSCAVSEYRASSDPTILNLGLPALPGDPATCRVIHISTDSFTSVVPRLADLPWLSHVRQVNTDNKATAQAIGDGWFSVVIGNRFPAGQTSGPARYIAHLVSLEGYAAYLTDAPSWPAGVTGVRLASLASWAFSSQANGEDFTALMTKLAGTTAGGPELRLRLAGPATAPAAGTPAADAAAALAQGYAALAYESRAGDESFAWYHGPLTPYPVAPVSPDTAFASASAATVYDPGSGTFDLSYATCWEAGRMLALRDRAYATAQQRSRAALSKTVNLLRERARWLAGGDHSSMLEPQKVSRSLGDALKIAVGNLGGPAQVRVPTTGAPSAIDGVRATLADPALPSTIRTSIMDAPPQSPTDTVVDWLAGLRLLEPVPFVHLVPDARMLPKKSIRFFHVDANALDALSDGAQSIGIATSRDAQQQQLARGPLRDAAIARAACRRAMAIDTQAPAPSDPVAGFLLRSAVVSGWPGLEVKAWADMAGTQEIAALRFDTVASDVLLVLYPQLPVRIDIEEPKEGLAFGVEAEWAVDLRTISGPDVGQQIAGANVTLDASYRPNGVLRVDAWQSHLAALPQFASDSALWGPAAFALQMVSAPERMIFANGASA